MSTQSLPSTCYPAPPPTTNTLDSYQRTRLLKSTRKLGAVLGTTPFLLEPPSSPPKLSLALPSTSPYNSYKEPPTPRTKKSRRSGRVFTPPSHSASSSMTSLSSYEESDDFVVIPPGGAGAGYHYHHLDISLPQNHVRGAIKVSLVPESVPKAKKGPKALPPPLLLRLRAVPVSSAAGIRDSVVSTSTMTSSAGTPVSPAFPRAQTTEREKRKKMDKLSRTFGESVPPELVFPSSAPAKKPTGPRPSDAQRRREKREGKKRAVYPLPPTPSPSPSSGLKQTPRRAPRPRSLTLVPPLSAFSSSTSSLPELTPSKKTHKPALSTPTLPLTRPSTSGSRTSEGKTHHTMHCRAHTVDNGHAGDNARAKEEFGHRKEREWSGEWNVEIDDVVRRLRALKA